MEKISREESGIVGIDLGTTNSSVAVWNESAQKVDIIKNIDGELITPSFVAVHDGEIVIGEIAKNIWMKSDPDKVDVGTKTCKRDMGTQTLVPFNGQKVPPYILGSYVLKALKKQAEDYLKVPVERAVITVPAYFSDPAIVDTRRAGEAAGFEVAALLAEPAAAALALGQMPKENTKLAVYDLGGGTFDISIIEVVGGRFVVRANHGDMHLGGDDFDEKLLKYALEQTDYGYLLHEKEANKIVLRKLQYLSVEDAKIRLSTLNSTRLRTSEFADIRGKMIAIDLTIPRASFEDLIKPKIDETIEHFQTAMKKAGVDIKSINDILLVGGSTLIPYVSERLEKEFGLPSKQLDPITCVTEGAAIHTRSLNWILEGKTIRFESRRKAISPTKEKKLQLSGKLSPREGYEDRVELSGATVNLTSDRNIQISKEVNKESGFMINTELQENTKNTFKLTVSDSRGHELDQFEFSIEHRTDAPEKKQITGIDNISVFPFSVGLAGQTKIKVLIEEQSPLPAEKEDPEFSLERDGQTELTVPIYQGKDPLPERNLWMGEVRITNLPPGLKRGDDVIVTFHMNESRLLHVSVRVPKAGIAEEKDVNVDMHSRDEIEGHDEKRALKELEKKLIGITDELDKKLPLLPSEHRQRVGNLEGRLRVEANEALHNAKVGELENKTGRLVELLQEVNNLVPDENIVKEFREDSRYARLLALRPGIASVDSSTVEENIKVGEEAIRTGNKEMLRKQQRELKNLLHKIVEDLGKNIPPERMLEFIIYQFENYKQSANQLLTTQGRGISGTKQAQTGIIDSKELGFSANTGQRSSEQIQREIKVCIARGDEIMPQAQRAVSNPDNYDVDALCSQLGFLMQTMDGLLTELREKRR